MDSDLQAKNTFRTRDFVLLIFFSMCRPVLYVMDNNYQIVMHSPVNYVFNSLCKICKTTFH